MTAPSICPVCGAEVPPNARACPNCGADERTGWDEEATRYDGLDLPESAFEDADAEKISDGDDRATARTPWFTWIAAALVLLAIAALVIRSVR